jgi:hypothetical protein
VEAAGIEKAFTPINSVTYGRNRCLKSASWTFASVRNPTAQPLMMDGAVVPGRTGGGGVEARFLRRDHFSFSIGER